MMHSHKLKRILSSVMNFRRFGQNNWARIKIKFGGRAGAERGYFVTIDSHTHGSIRYSFTQVIY